MANLSQLARGVPLVPNQIFLVDPDVGQVWKMVCCIEIHQKYLVGYERSRGAEEGITIASEGHK